MYTEMNICFITTFFMGATLPFMQHLYEKGHKCNLFLFANQGRCGEETLRFDVPVNGSKIKKLKKDNKIYNYLSKQIDVFIVPYFYVRNRRYLVGYIPFIKNLCILLRLIYILKKSKYDLIYIIVNEENDAMLCRLLKGCGFNNIIIAYHEVVNSHIGIQSLKKVVNNTIDYNYPIICHSNHTRNTLLSLSKGRLSSDMVKTIYFGPFETYRLFDTSVPIINEKYILFIGIIQPYKGLSFMYDSIKKYGQNINCKIVVAGKGNDSCLELMKNDTRYIIINRFLTDGEFANLMKYASCVVCPYLAGSQSGITHTAMIYDTPIVATSIGAFPEFIINGQNGYLVEKGDSIGLVRAINSILQERKKKFIPKIAEWDNIVSSFEFEFCSKKANA